MLDASTGVCVNRYVGGEGGGQSVTCSNERFLEGRDVNVMFCFAL